ncbi:hypothetical protein P3342_011049 [Pyrenophora teres f. teres]|uniref:MADS-box domain-containing protein n=2 Tax=Pyrenophora teres f. teres TaxID=97479 RepID=E3S9T4_PYRTT|nr:hypothetical protein PTT_19828 [Pyrenophora teres f. teres 0-1]KAE8822945.1 hypothetical protein PTNB85_10333 [Pyrenophora teres f. teres]KAE8832079.1 hypothetical protein HRS9139_06321 [Pyrenophora teres f. teres]KAE8835188.1 hypothetical protein HRS9122_07458 [Pyrenophora teres f. teres]KAE8858086.1 hypothetical protein PTNB29_07301 [Pyrenophora teres f. teres]
MTNQMHNKKLRRRCEGLSTKAYEYEVLDGVELALFIWYPRRGDFYSYGSAPGLQWIQDVEKMMLDPKATNELPDNVKTRAEQIRQKQKKQSRATLNKDRDEHIDPDREDNENVSGQEDDNPQDVVDAAIFPDPPPLKLTILGDRAGYRDS